jgi:membrane-associated protein
VYYINWFIDKIVHLDVTLGDIIQQYGTYTYAILFGVIFAETGFVFTPFLPGDSLLFAAGGFAAKGNFNINILIPLLMSAAILGDNVNYWVGRFAGEKLKRFLKQEYLDKTHEFYEKHGGKTLILAKYVPIVSTFAPFVAGIGKMTYPKFLLFNISGGITWVLLFVGGGYYFANIPIIKNNFTIVIFVIIFISILPGIIGYLKHKFGNKETA